MKKILSNIIVICSLLILSISQGCKDENPIVTGGLGSLYDPSIRPMVIFTYPGNNAIGPFTGLYAGDGMYSFPHFKIQFNKLMKLDLLGSENVSISGFDEPVYVQLQNYNSISGMYEFIVYKKDGYYSSIPTYQIGRSYTVTVASTAEDIHNQSLGKDVQFKFSTENTFKVTRATPKDSFTNSSSEVRLYFNSPVDTNIFSKISFTPAVQGSWYITNNGSSLIFYSNAIFPANTSYTLSLAANAADKFGNALGVPFTHNFKTGTFKVMNSYPSEGQTYVPLDYDISFYFNSSIQSSSVPAAFSISPAVSGTFLYYGNSFTFDLTEPLKEKTVYTVTLNNTLKSSSGISLTTPTTFSFTTEGFRVKQVYPYNYNSSRYSNIDVEFNSKIDTAGAFSGITITPTTAGKYYFSGNYRSIIFKPDAALLPKTTYSISVSSGLKSAAGNPLENNYGYSFTTGE
jgi:hypothetical protein